MTPEPMSTTTAVPGSACGFLETCPSLSMKTATSWRGVPYCLFTMPLSFFFFFFSNRVPWACLVAGGRSYSGAYPAPQDCPV